MNYYGPMLPSLTSPAPLSLPRAQRLVPATDFHYQSKPAKPILVRVRLRGGESRRGRQWMRISLGPVRTHVPNLLRASVQVHRRLLLISQTEPAGRQGIYRTIAFRRNIIQSRGKCMNNTIGERSSEVYTCMTGT